MWQLRNLTPFAAGQGWVRSLDGAETWIVVVKATFDVLEGGKVQIASTQLPPVRTPKYRGDPGRSSIVWDNDFVLAKLATDVIVNGTAYAPGSRAAGAVEVSFSVGSVSKKLRVVGDRSWNLAGAALSSPRPFVSLPLIYERSFGGVDRRSSNSDADWYWPNPIGTGYAVSDRDIADVVVPNIEYPDDPIRSWKGRPRPAGFGVLGPNWQQRAKYAGTYDQAWSDNRQPLLPADFDLRHFQLVPEDQQAPGFLSGTEPISLVNLTPDGQLIFSLPPVSLRMESRFMDGDAREHPPAQLHTIIIEPDSSRVSLVWHSAIECHAKVYKLDHTRIELATSDDDEDAMIESLLDL
jgi:hypothetical protein